MATFSLDIADVDVDRVLNALAANYNRPEQVPNPAYQPELDAEGNDIPPVDGNGDPIPQMVDNPETKGDFTHRMVRKFLSEHVSSYEIRVARDSALEGLDTTVTLSDSTQ